MDGIDRRGYPYSIQLLAGPVTVTTSLVLQDDVRRMVILQARYKKQSKLLALLLQYQQFNLNFSITLKELKIEHLKNNTILEINNF
jgi:hypothetical protein